MTRQPLCRIKSLPSVFNNSPSSPTFARAERLAEPHQRSSRVNEWKASPIHELLPPEVCEQVHQVASPSGGVVIEIQWSSSQYLPAHKEGRKYLRYAELLQELLQDRRAKGGPLPVHVLDKPISCKRRICCVLAKGCKNEQLFWTYDS